MAKPDSSTEQQRTECADSPVIAYFDGLVEPSNPGGYACGGFVTIEHRLCPAMSGHRTYCQGDGATNNVAEYEAALDALRAIYHSGYRGRVELRGDSQLVVRQFNGSYGCYKPHLQALLKKLKKAATMFAELQLVWVPREENEEADTQSRLAYQAVTGREPPRRR